MPAIERTTDRWITNLESEEKLAADVARAETALSAAKSKDERRTAEHMLQTAKYIQRDINNQRTKLLSDCGGRVDVGPPRATAYRSTDEIAALGIIGLYHAGAGDA